MKNTQKDLNPAPLGLCFFFLVVVLIGTGCESDDGSDEIADSDIDTDSNIENNDSDSSRDVDMLTSATPGKGAILSESHGNGAGFLQVSCHNCHSSIHSSGYRNGGECAHCHGSNGAPARQSGHQDSGCTESGCHDQNEAHDISSFSSPRPGRTGTRVLISPVLRMSRTV